MSIESTFDNSKHIIVHLNQTEPNFAECKSIQIRKLSVCVTVMKKFFAIVPS